MMGPNRDRSVRFVEGGRGTGFERRGGGVCLFDGPGPRNGAVKTLCPRRRGTLPWTLATTM